ncbi:MAG: 3-isopropylmalate dehydratase [Pseudomonadota bacterium]
MLGRVWKFGDAVDTDAIVSGKHLDAPLEEAAKFAFAGPRPEFAAQAAPGDVIVAGRNFGCGSSREQAAAVLKIIGLDCVIAESFGRIFFRNAIAVGLPVLVCPGAAEAFADGDHAAVSLADSRVVNRTNGRELAARPLSPEMIAILEKNGVIEYLKELVGRAS